MIVQWIFLTVLTLLVLSYVIYPLIAVVVGAGRVELPNDDLPAVSVLVPAHNEGSVIAAKIENFLALDYPSNLIELIIVDDGSTDNTLAVVGKYQSDRVRILEQETRQGKAAAMNRMAECASYPLLLFSDANVMFARNAVRRLVDHIGSPKIGAVTGEVRLIGSGNEFITGEALYYWLERRIQGAESRLGSVMGVDGGMYMVRRELFDTLRDDTILDDFAVSMTVMRAGRRVVYENAAKATESGTPSAKQEFNRRARIAAGAVQLLKRRQVPRLTQPVLWGQFISHKLLRWLSPILLLVLLVSNLLILEKSLLYQTAMFSQLGFYSLILAAWLISPLRRTSLGGVLFYFGISQAGMAVGLVRGILNRQPAQWEKGQRTEDHLHSSAVDP